MTGVGYALLSLLWARALMVLDVEELEAVVPLSSLVIVPCVVVYPCLLYTSQVVLVDNFSQEALLPRWEARWLWPAVRP